MLKAIALFAAGFYFGRNRNATQQVLDAGAAVLNTQRDTVQTDAVLPNTNIISPERAVGCPDGYTFWPQYKACLDPKQDAEARAAYEAGKEYRPRGVGF